MRERTTWERFFDAHAPTYDDNVFTKNTVHEVDFLLDELLIPPGGAVLDVGCGTGRHAWVRSNATQSAFPGRHDAAACLCEGAFGLLGQSDDPIEQPMSILCNISRGLKPRAKAVFSVLSGASMLRKFQNKDVAEGRFDPLTMVASSEHPPQEGLPAVVLRERACVPTELLLLFRMAGMSVGNMWGGMAGNWGRSSLDLDEIEIMIVACKTAEPLASGDLGRPPA